MKKWMALFLTLLMLATVAAPVSSLAAAADEPTPIIYLRGNGEPIYDEDENEVVADIGDIMIGGDDEEDTRNKIIEAVGNILYRFAAEGLLFDQWDRYGQAIYDEISPLFEKAMLDGDGNPQYGTGVKAGEIEKSERIAAGPDLISGGKYNFYSYAFRYDWRLDPYDHVDRLHEYIQTVRRATGRSQVSLTSRCLGGSVMTAYLEKYGGEGLVKNAMYCETLTNGLTVISKGFSGQIDFDSNSIQRYAGQMTYLGELGLGFGISIPELADNILTKSLDLFNQLGVIDSISGGIEGLYNRLYKALIPALFRATGLASQPIYWTFVKDEDFDAAMQLMFGEEGSDLRTENAGLIAKIEDYRAKVTSQGDALYRKFADDFGIHVGVMAKYGLLNAPIVVGFNEPSDGLTSLKYSSFGATCADVGATLSDANTGEYISPDRQVDASTGLFPETTWYIKNIHHDDFDTTCQSLAETFLNGTGVTVDNSGFARFLIKDSVSKTISEMTEENCADLEFISRPKDEPTTTTKLFSFFDWLVSIFNLILRFFRGEISF